MHLKGFKGVGQSPLVQIDSKCTLVQIGLSANYKVHNKLSNVLMIVKYHLKGFVRTKSTMYSQMYSERQKIETHI